MIEKIDAASLRWPAPVRWFYLLIKWTLVCLGALFLWLSFVAKAGFFWGSMLIVGPLLWGCLQGIRELQRQGRLFPHQD